MKVYIFRKGILPEIFLNRVLAKICICEKTQITWFLDLKYFEQGLKQIVLDKNLQKFGKAIQIYVFRDSFLTFLIDFMCLKISIFFVKKSDFFGEKCFLCFFGQKSDNLNRFLVKFHSKLNISIYFILVQTMAKTIFTKSCQIVPISPH